MAVATVASAAASAAAAEEVAEAAVGAAVRSPTAKDGDQHNGHSHWRYYHHEARTTFRHVKRKH